MINAVFTPVAVGEPAVRLVAHGLEYYVDDERFLSGVLVFDVGTKLAPGRGWKQLVLELELETQEVVVLQIANPMIDSLKSHWHQMGNGLVDTIEFHGLFAAQHTVCKDLTTQ